MVVKIFHLVLLRVTMIIFRSQLIEFMWKEALKDEISRFVRKDEDEIRIDL